MRTTPWDLLLRCGVAALPVRVAPLCRALGVGLCSYSQGYELLRRLRLGACLHDSDGFLFRLDAVPVIFYNQSRPVCRQRFTVAHELGHLALGHSGPLLHRTAGRPDSPAERAANSFAADLLSPPCVLGALGVASAPQIARLCRISTQAAACRMDQLRRRYPPWGQWTALGYPPLSPQENQLCRRFAPFIQAVRARQLALWPPRAPRPCGAARPAGG